MIPSSACQPGRADQPGNAGSTATKAASYTTRWDTIEAAGVDFVVDRLCGIFGNDVKRHVGRAMMTNWGAEKYVRGAYAAARPGKAGAREILSRPVAERIWFAGEHLAGPLVQTCGGARLSGEAVAREVLATLG